MPSWTSGAMSGRKGGKPDAGRCRLLPDHQCPIRPEGVAELSTCKRCKQERKPLWVRFRLWRLSRMLGTMALEVNVASNQFCLSIVDGAMTCDVPDRFFRQKIQEDEMHAVYRTLQTRVPDNVGGKAT